MRYDSWSDNQGGTSLWKLVWADVCLRLILPYSGMAGTLANLTGIALCRDRVKAGTADIIIHALPTSGFVIIAGMDHFEISDSTDLYLRVLSLIGSLLLERTHHSIVHAGAIQTRMGALLFCGPSYVGKSTLGFFAWQAGQTLMGDDRLVYHPDTASVSPFPKPLKPRVGPDFQLPLCSGGDLHFVGRLENENHRVIPRSMPGITPLDGRVSVHRIYFLERSDTSTSTLRSLTAVEALPRWMNQMMFTRSGSMLSSLATLEACANTGRVKVLRVGVHDTHQALQLMLAGC